jgi:hypothetical protein
LPATVLNAMISVVDRKQVIEPAAGIGHRPTVEHGLHLRYPLARPAGSPGGAPIFAGASSGLATCSSSPNRGRPSLCTGLSSARSTTAAPPRPRPLSRRHTQPRPPRRTRGSRAGQGWFPCSLRFAPQGRSPADALGASLRVRRRPSLQPPGHRFHDSRKFPSRSSPARTRRSRHTFARFESMPALRASRHRFLAYASLACSPGTRHLAVLASGFRPG